MLLAIAALIIGIALLVWGADRFVDGAASVAKNLRVPPMIIGLTIVSLGTSLPEMIVAAMAALDGNRNLGVGNVIGSNIANIGLVLGITALIIPLSVKSMTLRREMPVLFMITLLAFALMADGGLSFSDGVILSLSLLLLLGWITLIAMQDRHDPLVEEFTDSIPDNMSMGKSVMWFIVGLLLLIISSRMVVWGAIEIAHYFGVSDLIIGLTIVAIGTSLPELAVSVVSALKGDTGIAVGNVIGSNVFNLLAVVGVAGWIHPATFDPSLLTLHHPMMIAFTVPLLLIAYNPFGKKGLSRGMGFALLAAYIAYQAIVVGTSI